MHYTFCILSTEKNGLAVPYFSEIFFRNFFSEFFLNFSEELETIYKATIIWKPYT